MALEMAFYPDHGICLRSISSASSSSAAMEPTAASSSA
jgi:hypothetical protein